MIKHIKIIAVLILISIQLFSSPVSKYGQLQVIGTKLCDSAENPVVLRGMSFGWHNWWPRFYQPETVKWLANDWKASVVRAAMGVDATNSYLNDSANSIATIRKVIDGAIENGLYVIIDWHSHALYNQQAKEFFKLMATEYGHYPNIIYEIFNEPMDQTWTEVKQYSIEIINAIRNIDPDNIILVGSPSWCQDLHLAAADPIVGQTNIMYTMHFYAATHKQWLRDRCDNALATGLPIFVSECASMLSTGDGDLDIEEWNTYVKWMEKNQISWLMWSIADKDESCSVLKKSALSTGNWATTDLKEWGTIARGELRKFNASFEPGRIYNAMAKARRGDDIIIGVIGGSITAGTAASSESKRWANQMTDWWKQKFTGSNVTLINAGWGGTGSDIGAHRAYDDLLSKNPDFIVIEFSVNDTEGSLATKMMEGLVQQAIVCQSTPGIMVLALKQENGSNAMLSHKKVTDYYNIPLVNYVNLIDSAVAADGLTLHSIYSDGVHPNDKGMTYIANFIKQQLDSIYATLPDDNQLPAPNTFLPAPLVTDTYSSTYQYFTKNLVPVENSGWRIEDAGWESETVGSQISFRIRGNAVSLVFTQNISANRGRAEVWVDNGPKKIIDAFMNENWGTRYAFALVNEGLTNDDHILNIKIISESSTSGNFVQLSRVLVAGNIGSAAPIAITTNYQKSIVGYNTELEGGQSFDPDGELITAYNWSFAQKPTGSATTITNSNKQMASFIPDIAGDYIVNLVVTAGFLQSIPAVKTVKVRASNAKPVAVVGNDTASALNKNFNLVGNKSYDTDGDPLTYNWKIVSKPQGSTSVLFAQYSATARTKFDIEGEYVFSLVVSDSIELSQTATITINAIDGYTQVNSIIADNNIEVFPNPTNGNINITFINNSESFATIEMYSAIGKKVFSKIIDNSFGQSVVFTTNLQQLNLQPGIYIISVKKAGITNAFKVNFVK